MPASTVDRLGAARIVAALVVTFEREAEYLNALDAQIGDGDHGLSMLKGLRALSEHVVAHEGEPLGQLLAQGGRAFNEAAGYTIGILMLSALKSAGEALSGEEVACHGEALAMLDAAIAGIMARGKAKAGQKTILGSLLPAAAALRAHAVPPASVEKAVAALVDAAHAGAEGTRDLVSTMGRARWFENRSKGVVDPGAWSGYLIVKTIGDAVLSGVVRPAGMEART
jgi:phosphoenolpyruvate---glycerone phosphotransferase subunit DhaL